MRFLLQEWVGKVSVRVKSTVSESIVVVVRVVGSGESVVVVGKVASVPDRGCQWQCGWQWVMDEGCGSDQGREVAGGHDRTGGQGKGRHRSSDHGRW